jgi:hypothetical protein
VLGKLALNGLPKKYVYWLRPQTFVMPRNGPKL